MWQAFIKTRSGKPVRSGEPACQVGFLRVVYALTRECRSV